MAPTTPLIADGDTGYGGLLNVQYSVRGYEAAGAIAIQLEDQEFPKKCGHMLGRRVVPIEDMVDKIKVAVASRDDKQFSHHCAYRRENDARARRSAAPCRRLCQGRRGYPVRRKPREHRGNAHHRPKLRSSPCGQHGRRRSYAGCGSNDAGGARLFACHLSCLRISRRRRRAAKRVPLSERPWLQCGANVPLYKFSEFSELMGFRAVAEFDETYRK